jgi:hypothetical protein
MENRINKKVNDYIQSFKNDMILKINNDGFEKKNDLIKYIYDYNNFKLVTEDINKRQRNKTTICSSERCQSKRSNGEQCSRRRRGDCKFCGTHEKGQPHGVIDKLSNDDILIDNNNNNNNDINVDVYTEEHKGIIYFKDNNNQYYNTDDVMMGKKNPKKIEI